MRTKRLGMTTAVAVAGVFAIAGQASAAPIDDLFSAVTQGAQQWDVVGADAATIYPVLGPVGTTAGAFDDPTTGEPLLDAIAQNPDLDSFETGVDTRGVFRTNAIRQGFTSLYNDGDFGLEVTGTFSGLKDFYVVQTGSGEQTISGTGLRIDIYANTFGTQVDTGPAGFTGPSGYTTVSDTGTLLLSLESLPGHFIPDPASNGGDAAEFVSTFDPLTLQGSSEAWMEVVGGLWAPFYDTNTLFGPGFTPGTDDLADVKIQVGIDPNGPGSGFDLTWDLTLDDPLLANGVPVPGAGVAGLAMMGALGFIRRRRQA